MKQVTCKVIYALGEKFPGEKNCSPGFLVLSGGRALLFSAQGQRVFDGKVQGTALEAVPDFGDFLKIGGDGQILYAAAVFFGTKNGFYVPRAGKTRALKKALDEMQEEEVKKALGNDIIIKTPGDYFKH
jgi:hypothetical protein